MKKLRVFLIISFLLISLISFYYEIPLAKCDIENIYVDNDTTNIDNSDDIGYLTNFSDIQGSPNSKYARLNETKIELEFKNDFVDVDTSNVDGISDIGTHSNFNYEKAVDGYPDDVEEVYIPQEYPSEWLNVDSYEDRNPSKNWDNYVGSSPYLDDKDYSTNYIHEVSTSRAISGDYGFENTSLTGGLGGTLDVNISIYCRTEDTDDYIDVYMDFNNGSGFILVADDLVGAHTGWRYDNVTIGSVLPNEVNEARIYLETDNGGGGDDYYVDHVRLGVKGVEFGYYKMSLEVQFQNVSAEKAELCIYTGFNDPYEDMNISIWTDSGWVQLDSGLDQLSWNNYSISDYVNETITIHYFDAKRDLLDYTQSYWEIDACMLYSFNDTMRLDQEMAWDEVYNNSESAELCIYAGTMDNEDLEVYIWNKTSSAWHLVFSDLIGSSWNNQSIIDFIIDPNEVYIRYLDGNQTIEDNDLSEWYLDSVLISFNITFPDTPNLFFGAGFNASTPYIELYWNHSGSLVTDYELQNSTDKLSWDILAYISSTSYNDTSPELNNGSYRYYRVRARRYTGLDYKNSSWADTDLERVYFEKGAGVGALSQFKYPTQHLLMVVFLCTIGIILVGGAKR